MSKEKATYEEALRRCETYRRQLGGSEAALRRERQRAVEAEDLARDMLLTLVLASAGNIDPCELNARIVGYTERIAL